MRIFLTLLFSLIAVVASAQPSVNARTVFVGVTGSTCAIRSGTGAPGTGLGAVCDTYIRKDSPYTIYVKTGASTWSEIYRAGGTDVAVADGGTGLSSYTTGDLLYASAATTLAGRAAVASGSLLASAGTSTAPVWASSPTVSGTLTAQTSISSPTHTSTGAVNITTGGTTNLTLNPTADVLFDPTGNDAYPVSNYDLNLGLLTNKWLTLHAAELWVETLVAQNTIATIGGRVLVAPTNILAEDLDTSETTITFRYNNLSNGDIVMMESSGKVEFMTVTSSASANGSDWDYTVTRNADGTGANLWYAGDAVLNTRQTGAGFMDLYSYSGFTNVPFQNVYNFNNTGSVYSSNYNESATWAPLGDGAGNEVNDAVYFGAASNAHGGTNCATTAGCAISLNVLTAGAAGTGTRVWEYWNGASWTTFTPSAGAGVLLTAGQQSVVFPALTSWATTTVNSVSAYWVRWRMSVCSSCTGATASLARRAGRGVGQWGPAIVGNVRNSSTFNDWSPRWAIGNLNGLYGYGTDTYGTAFGDYGNSYLTIDATNGIRMIGDQGTMFSMTAAGDATFAGNLTIGTGRNILSNTEFLRGRGTGDSYRSYWGGSDATTTVDPNATYTCATTCSQRATHGSGWQWLGVDEDTSGSMSVGADASTSYRPLGSNTIYFQITSGTPSNGTYGRIVGPVIPVDDGLLYEYSIYAALSGTWSTRARILWYGEDGADGGDQPDLISQVDGTTVCTAGTASPDIGTWCRAGGIFTPPSGARLAALAVISIYDGNDGTPTTFVTKPFFAQATTGQTTLTPWGPGGQTLITGDMLSTDLVVANTLRSAGATALGTGTGYWLDATGTPTFRVGDPAGNRLSWDGTNLTLTSQYVTISSSGITIAPTTDYADARAYAFTTSSDGKLGLYAYDTTSRSARVYSQWTGTGNKALAAQIYAGNNPVSGGTNVNAAVTASIDSSAVTTTTVTSSNGIVSLAPSSLVQFTGQTGISNRLSVRTDNASCADAVCMRSDGYYLVIESRSTANGGTIYLGYDTNANVNLTAGGGTTVVNNSLRLNGLASCTLQVDGSGYVGCVSDSAAKQDITTWTPGLDAISKLRPVSYRWKNGTDTGKHIGFIAQEVGAVIPESVQKQQWGGMLTLDDRAILAALVNAVQELQRKQQ